MTKHTKEKKNRIHKNYRTTTKGETAYNKNTRRKQRKRDRRNLWNNNDSVFPQINYTKPQMQASQRTPSRINVKKRKKNL